MGWTLRDLRSVIVGMMLLTVLQTISEFSIPHGQPDYPRRHSEAELAAARQNLPVKPELSHYDVIIVGGGASGLTMGAQLKHSGISYIIFEKEEPGNSWLKRYHRLHLHTIKSISHLPFWPMPSYLPQFVSREDVAAYQRAYAQFLNVRTHTAVTSAVYNATAKTWSVTVANAAGEKTLTCNVLVAATGQEAAPLTPKFPGQETFPGTIVHSQNFPSSRGHEGKRVLVVGFGNSGSELAIDLWEWGAKPTVLVRSPINIAPRSLTMVFHALFPVLRSVPPEHADGTQGLVYSLLFSDLKQYNLTLKTEGIVKSVVEKHHAPIIDIGALELIRRKEINVVAANISSIAGSKVHFSDGSSQEFDTIVLATGYDMTLGAHAAYLTPELSRKLKNAHGVVPSGVENPLAPRLYFMGFNDYLGRLKEMHIDSRNILNDILKKNYVSKVANKV